MGQVLTPQPIAEFMASFFEANWSEVKILDAGAGTGILSLALIKRLCQEQKKPKNISLTVYEIDHSLIAELDQTVRTCREACLEAGIFFSAHILNEDFIKAAIPMVGNNLFLSHPERFNAVIVNPPYRKIRSDSSTRMWLSSVGIETSNLYSGFLALLFRLVSDNGELVAITPRSFCNGPYFKPFRQQLLESMSLRRLHVFESRSVAFQEDNVLQENIIFHAVKSKLKPERVIVSSSGGEPGSDIKKRECLYQDVIMPGDPDLFIHLVTDESQHIVRKRLARFTTSLKELNMEVSTGRVVDFRAREFLRNNPEEKTVPLIYPCHFNGLFVQWPNPNSKKPNGILDVEQIQDLLIPQGIYVLTKRFTSKEEKRRIVACIYNPENITVSAVGFENHLNYFHMKGSGLPMNLAKGLAVYLNSTMVDVYFRQFNGHTQVNATDLRSLKYPTRMELEKLGSQIGNTLPKQTELDELIEKVLRKIPKPSIMGEGIFWE